MNRIIEKAPEQSAITTIIKLSVDANGLTSVAKALPRHRGFHHHQVMVFADGPSAGEWNVRYVPDADSVEQKLADSGETLTLGGADSAMVIFPAALKTVVLQEVIAGTSGRLLTFIITSMKGHLLNP